MDANSFSKRIVLVALVSALPAFVSVASPGGGSHSSSGSNGGHSSSGSNGGHSSSSSNSGHSSSASNGAHSSTASKGAHSASDPPTGPASVLGGRSLSGMHVTPNTVRKASVSVASTRNFSSGGPSGQVGSDGNDEWRLHHRRLLFGFLPF
jgi:hypothetical protein